MSSRVTGYHYELGADGRKHRVYDRNTRAPAAAGPIARAPAYRAPPRRYAPAPRRYAAPMRGQGSYYNSNFVKTMRKALPEGSFAKAGSMVGGPLGGYAGGLLAKIAGFGDYKVSSNSLIGEGQSPAMMHSGKDSFVVRHREYICDLLSDAENSGQFQNQAFPIQPGLATTFPWLAPIAAQFEQYVVRGMVFEFKSLYSDAVVGTGDSPSLGGVIMATDYNVLNSEFTTKQQMDNTQYTTSCKPSVSFYHPIECKPNSMPTNQLFVRTGAVPGDQRLYDLGLLQIATFGIQALGASIGELWCTYEIEFSKPIASSLTENTLSDHYHLTGTVAAATALGTTSTLVPGSSIAGTITTDASSRPCYQFPPSVTDGTFMFIWSVVGTSTASLNTPTISVQNGQILELWNGDASVASVTTGTSGGMHLAFAVQLGPFGSVQPGQPTQVSFSTGGTLPASITGGDLFVLELDADIVT